MREFEHWTAIKETTLLIHQINEAISDNTEEEKVAALEAKKREGVSFLNQLMEQVETFGVVPPEKCPEPTDKGLPDPPEGKRWFWGWDTFMQKLQFHVQQELTICSGCTFFLPKSDGICCRVFPGSLGSLVPNNFTCAMVKFEHWSQQEQW